MVLKHFKNQSIFIWANYEAFHLKIYLNNYNVYIFLEYQGKIGLLGETWFCITDVISLLTDRLRMEYLAVILIVRLLSITYFVFNSLPHSLSFAVAESAGVWQWWTGPLPRPVSAVVRRYIQHRTPHTL